MAEPGSSSLTAVTDDDSLKTLTNDNQAKGTQTTSIGELKKAHFNELTELRVKFKFEYFIFQMILNEILF